MFNFQHPEYLWLLGAVPVLWLLLFRYQQWRRTALARLGDTSRLMSPFSEIRFWAKGGLLTLAFLFLALAWANLQWGAKKQTTTQKAADVFIAMDISQSMLCRDIAPSRLELTKIFAQKLVQTLEGERIGLIFLPETPFWRFRFLLIIPLSCKASRVPAPIYLRSKAPQLLPRWNWLENPLRLTPVEVVGSCWSQMVKRTMRKPLMQHKSPLNQAL